MEGKGDGQGRGRGRGEILANSAGADAGAGVEIEWKAGNKRTSATRLQNAERERRNEKQKRFISPPTAHLPPPTSLSLVVFPSTLTQHRIEPRTRNSPPPYNAMSQFERRNIRLGEDFVGCVHFSAKAWERAIATVRKSGEKAGRKGGEK